MEYHHSYIAVKLVAIYWNNDLPVFSGILPLFKRKSLIIAKKSDWSRKLKLTLSYHSLAGLCISFFLYCILQQMVCIHFYKIIKVIDFNYSCFRLSFLKKFKNGNFKFRSKIFKIEKKPKK